MLSRRTAPRAALVAVIAAGVVWLGALILPLYSDSSSNGGSDRATLFEVNGARVLLVLAIPFAIAVIGLLASDARLPRAALPIACVLMWVWTLLTGFSVGLFYLSADAALVVAVAATPKRRAIVPPSVA